jgi:hypothetical protein
MNNNIKKNICILYDSNANLTNNFFDYLNSFKEFSTNNIFYLDVGYKKNIVTDLNLFDTIILFHTLCGNRELLSKILINIQKYTGYTIAFVQDEYDCLNYAPYYFSLCGVNTIVTALPKNIEQIVYPKHILPNVDFIHALTAYIPTNLKNKQYIKPLDKRNIYIGYRGRTLHMKYGQLGQDKIIIGKKMLSNCQERNIPSDISWDENDRIYGNEWINFIENCHTVLGTECGSDIFDFSGQLRQNIDNYLQKYPNTTYEEIYDKYLKEMPKYSMRLIAPRIFEAISLGTGLILFEGEYSNILEPWKHYIPLKKDWSNIDIVLNYVYDTDKLQNIINNAYNDIIISNKYS